jgi:rubrerythrin
MSNGVKLKLDEEIIKLLDKYRGDLSRDDFITRILEENLKKKDKIDFSKYDMSGSETELEPVDFNLQEFMDDFKQFADNIYNRLDRLESLLNNQIIPSDTIEMRNHELESDEFISDKRDESMIFEIEESEEDTIEDDQASDIYGLDEIGDEFEYGCPYCNATISGSATVCPNCGNKFDDNPKDSGQAVQVEPLPEYYSDTGEYDPRPRYVRKENYEVRPKVNKSPKPNSSYPTFKGVGQRMCSDCGNKMDFIKDYKRWYCYNCKKYAGATVSGSPTDPKLHRSNFEPTPSFDKSVKINNNQRRNVSRKKPYHGKRKPLKDYPKYRG